MVLPGMTSKHLADSVCLDFEADLFENALKYPQKAAGQCLESGIFQGYLSAPWVCELEFQRGAK